MFTYLLAVRASGAHSQHRLPAPASKLQQLVTPLNVYSLSPRSCPPTLSARSERFGTDIDTAVEATQRSPALALCSLQKGCGLWTLSCDFVPHS